jgi:uncharacterized protein (DUF362 family)
MKRQLVSIVTYENPYDSVKKAVELCNGLAHLPTKPRVFIKPNILWWTTEGTFPKWGSITTSRVVEDMVVILKEHGIDDIIIGEGMVIDPKDNETPAAAFESLGYNALIKRFGIKCVNIHERPFQAVDLGSGNEIKFNNDMLESDFLVDIPVLKTHVQTVVSLGIKNLKGLIDIESRKRCHTTSPEMDLHRYVSKFLNVVPPSFTILDGIFSNETGPTFVTGQPRRSNILIASGDMLSADMVGARVLGYQPSQVPHLMLAAQDNDRPIDFSDIQVVGEEIEKTVMPHEFAYPFDEEKQLPPSLVDLGVTGITTGNVDLTLCTYCAGPYPSLMNYLAMSWTGEPWDNVEILAGKEQQPTPGKKKTILFGKCIYQAHKDNPDIQEMIPIKGCPPTDDSIRNAFTKAGIDLSPLFGDLSTSLAFLMDMYKDQPDFDETFYAIQE